MCGITGYVGKNKNAIPVIISGLESLEYRGYDSAGIAYVKENEVNIVKEQGKIINFCLCHGCYYTYIHCLT